MLVVVAFKLFECSSHTDVPQLDLLVSKDIIRMCIAQYVLVYVYERKRESVLKEHNMTNFHIHFKTFKKGRIGKTQETSWAIQAGHV